MGAKRKKTGSWINSNIFIAAWKAIKEEGVWASKDWTVKGDADAVFLPIRLRNYSGKVEVTENGIYLENCKYVSYGFFGSLEVLCMVLTRFLLSTSTLTRLAQHGGLRAKRR